MSEDWILVVDDDEDVRDAVSMVLDMRGYAVTAASDGLEALQQIRSRGRPALIILDLRMPRMNGEELAAALHVDPSLESVPIVVFSGDTNAREVATALGARALLAKPVALRELVAVVQGVVDSAAMASV